MRLELRGLSKLYGTSRGLQPLTLTVAPGELLAVVGHNGAGKSTLLKLLSGWIRPDAGEAFIGDAPLSNRLAVVYRVGFVPETPNLYDLFSVGYNLKLFAQLLGLPRSRVAQVLNEFELEPFRRSRVQTLSKGLKQRVSLGRSLLPDPSVLLFDEPTSGLDFAVTKELYRRLAALHAAGKTIIFTSHRPEELRLLATRILVLHAGEVAFDGTPDAYFASETHRDLYQ